MRRDPPVLFTEDGANATERATHIVILRPRHNNPARYMPQPDLTQRNKGRTICPLEFDSQSCGRMTP